MSRNLVEMIRRHHAVGAPTALAVLKEAVEQRGEITDDDRRVAAERSGLPEAAVHGVSTFYDDLLAPRGARHVRVCTGTACFAATGDAHVDALRAGLGGGGLGLGERSADGAVSLAETVCLGFCHASPAIRDGDVIDAGPGVVERVLAGASRPAPEPLPRSVLPGGPQLLATGLDWAGLQRALATMTPEELLAQVTEAEVRGRGGAGFPAGSKWAFARAAPGEPKFIVANGDEGDPGSYIDKVQGQQGDLGDGVGRARVGAGAARDAGRLAKALVHAGRDVRAEALRQSLGLSGATGSFDDIEAAEAAIIIGANPTEGHPVAGARIKQATLRGMALVTIDPRRIELSDYAVLHLSPRPGSNAAVMLGLAHVVARDGLLDRAFLDARTEGWDAVEDLLADYTPADVQRISGIPAADLERAAHIYGEAGEASILWGLGVTEHKYGSEVVRLICNLALMCGKVGRPGSALLPLRGQNNVQGSSDMGARPTRSPATSRSPTRTSRGASRRAGAWR